MQDIELERKRMFARSGPSFAGGLGCSLQILVLKGWKEEIQHETNWHVWHQTNDCIHVILRAPAPYVWGRKSSNWTLQTEKQQLGL